MNARIGRLFLFLALPLAGFLATSSGGRAEGPNQDEAALKKAAERANNARVNLDLARNDLEDEYRRLESAFGSLREDGGTRFVNHLQERVAALYPRLMSYYRELETVAAEHNKNVTKRRVTQSVELLINEDFKAKPPCDPGLSLGLKTSLAGHLAQAIMRGAEGPRQSSEKAMADSLNLKEPFHIVWNNSIYATNPIAQAYATAYDAYIAAGAELQRLRTPGAFLPGGKKVRPGMVYIEGGTYQVGPNTGFERKKRKVTVRPYLIDRYEVTNNAFRVFFETLPADERIKRLPHGWELDDNGQPVIPPDQGEHPVAGVTWVDAKEYAEFVGKRLPTEEEWEIAAGGRDQRLYPWGAPYDPKRCNGHDAKVEGTVAVGSIEKGATPEGCADFAGNVSEWTASGEDGQHVQKLKTGLTTVVIRGGSFLDRASRLTVQSRWIAPGLRTRESFIGFRCVATPE